MILDDDFSDLMMKADKDQIRRMQEKIKNILDHTPNIDKATEFVFNEIFIKKTEVFRPDRLRIKATIQACIQFHYGTYILFDPETTKPAVILQPEYFLAEEYIRREEFDGTNIVAMVVEFFQNQDTKSSTKKSKTALVFAGKTGGEYLLSKSKGLRQMADWMGSRAGKREVSKKVEKEMMQKLWRKSTKGVPIDQAKRMALDKLAKSAAQNATKSAIFRNVGRIALKMGEVLSLRVVGASIDVLWPTDLADGTVVGRQKALVLSEISKYCRENYNIDYYISVYKSIHMQVIRPYRP